MGCWRKKNTFIKSSDNNQTGEWRKEKKTLERQRSKSEAGEFSLNWDSNRLTCARRDPNGNASDRKAFDCVLSWCHSTFLKYFLSINYAIKQLKFIHHSRSCVLDIFSHLLLFVTDQTNKKIIKIENYQATKFNIEAECRSEID